MSDPTQDDYQPSEDDIAAVARLKDAFDRLKAEMGKVIVGPARGPRGAADRDLRPRPLPADRRARAWPRP